MAPHDRRDPQLDGLRGLAALLVLVFHATAWDRIFSPDELVLLVGPALGWCGVDLFFVLSGFLITRILLEQKGSPRYYRTFYGRRILRIFPLYYLFLFVSLFVLPGLGSETFGNLWVVPEGLRQPAWYWLYLSNFYDGLAGTVHHNLLGPTWSLAIEEQFYLVWPFLVLRLSSRRLAWLALAMVGTSFGLRCAALAWDAGPMAVYALTPMRMDLLAAGAWIATQLHRPQGLAGWARGAGLAFAVASAAVLALAIRLTWEAAYLGGSTTALAFHPTMQMLGYPLILVAWSALLVVLLTSGRRSPARRLFETLALRRLGRVSYGVYLFNVPVILALNLWLHPSPGRLWDPAWQVIHWVLALALSVGLAELSWRLFEAPILRAKRWFPYDRTPPGDGLGPPASPGGGGVLEVPVPGLGVPEMAGAGERENAS